MQIVIVRNYNQQQSNHAKYQIATSAQGGLAMTENVISWQTILFVIARRRNRRRGNLCNVIASPTGQSNLKIATLVFTLIRDNKRLSLREVQ